MIRLHCVCTPLTGDWDQLSVRALAVLRDVRRVVLAGEVEHALRSRRLLTEAHRVTDARDAERCGHLLASPGPVVLLGGPGIPTRAPDASRFVRQAHGADVRWYGVGFSSAVDRAVCFAGRDPDDVVNAGIHPDDHAGQALTDLPVPLVFTVRDPEAFLAYHAARFADRSLTWVVLGDGRTGASVGATPGEGWAVLDAPGR